MRFWTFEQPALERAVEVSNVCWPVVFFVGTIRDAQAREWGGLVAAGYVPELMLPVRMPFHAVMVDKRTPKGQITRSVYHELDHARQFEAGIKQAKLRDYESPQAYLEDERERSARYAEGHAHFEPPVVKRGIGWGGRWVVANPARIKFALTANRGGRLESAIEEGRGIPVGANPIIDTGRMVGAKAFEPRTRGGMRPQNVRLTPQQPQRRRRDTHSAHAVKAGGGSIVGVAEGRGEQVAGRALRAPDESEPLR